MTDTRPARRWHPAILWIVIVLATGIAIIAVIFVRPYPRPQSGLLTEARTAMARGRFSDAQRLCEQILQRDPQSGTALLLAGRSAARLQNPQAALAFLQQLPETGTTEIAEGWYSAGEIALQLGQASAAETFLRRALAIVPRHLPASVRLAYLLGVEGRCWEAIPFLMASVRQQDFTVHHLVLLGASEPVIADQELIERCRRAVPDNPLPLISLARTALQQNAPKQAESLLREVIAAAPHCVEAHATLGRVLSASHPDAIPEWQSKLPTAADDHPDIWSVRGEWAEQRGESRVAVRCFWEAVRRNPNHRVANFHLGQLLIAMNEPQSAQPYADRADRLRELVLLVDRLYAQPDTLSLYHQAAELTESLGRLWEAWGWSRIALDRSPDLAWAAENMERLQARLTPDLPQTLASANPALRRELSSYPLPQWPVHQTNPTRNGSDSSSCVVKFEDVAPAVGLEFTYFNRPGSKIDGMRMLETTGGGVAVLDYDVDSQPDLYFTQGCPWPPDADQRSALDQLFRNRGNGHFDRVTGAAGVGDPCYSQGVTCGDYDNDGFPDLYVANIGENRLYHNNGDGTFSDITGSAGIRGELWTTSCLIADLNGDSLPDLYDVNYLSAQAAATQICRQGDEVRWCSPDAFEAEQDQVYLNLGDGRFQNVTTSSGIVVPNGKGLGIVAADLDDSGRLSLFIANDAVANFLFVNQTQRPGDPMAFVERAVPAGLAFDRDGLPQACMGVAAGDADGDGRLDLFVTNYADQSNTLYRQQSGLLFEDDTRRAGLRDPSFAMLGFGTQFLDGELDGRPDLVLTNGHVFDLSYKGTPFEMPPQYYRNLGGGRFAEIPGSSLGPFFQRKSLGRGLARLDWNHDGREDFVVSHINSPAALVENQTPQVGHFLSLELRGTQCSRDAIGTVMRLVSAERTWTRQLTAGDGYQATNERRVVFGLGTKTQIDELHVRWPSGTSQVFRSLPVDYELLLIEGRPQSHAMSHRP